MRNLRLAPLMVEKITFGAFFLEGSPTEIKDSNFERWSPCHHHSRCDYFCSTIKTNSWELGAGTQKFLGIIHYLGWYRNSTGKICYKYQRILHFLMDGSVPKTKGCCFSFIFSITKFIIFFMPPSVKKQVAYKVSRRIVPLM